MMQINMKRRPTFKTKKKMKERKPKPTPIKESLEAWLDLWEEIAK